ncbi:hypothetical protein GDO81_005596 [Engystomops pustulosus]|uniref:Uncharacterized protein n=1 Tax=Engystomops pustulosus TaxID=76066 RepID=A0AAV7CQ04_ENGPU|nr:hypothetical protein GDO81_005596 [Engystomops pustulosus]
MRVGSRAHISREELVVVPRVVQDYYIAGAAGVSSVSCVQLKGNMANQIKDKEAFERLNFLYQAAHCVLAANPENVELARFYCHTQKTIGKRLVLRHSKHSYYCHPGCSMVRALFLNFKVKV